MYKIEQLIDFCAVVDNGGHHQASRAIHKSQPAITLSIKKLEEQLEYELFDRAFRKGTLSEKGKIFYQGAKRILRQQEELRKTSEMLKIGVQPRISISMDCLIPQDRFVAGLKEFRVSFPDVDLSISVDYFDIPMERLKNGECDIAICPSYGEKSGLYQHVIGNFTALPVITEEKLATDENSEEIFERTQIILSGSQANSAKIHNADSHNKWLVFDWYVKYLLIREGPWLGHYSRALCPRRSKS